jgi:hypothetical protein
VVDACAIQSVFEDRIRKAKHQDVLHRLFAEVMVDAVNLPSYALAVNSLFNACARRDRAERFFNDNPLPELRRLVLDQQPRAAEVLDDLGKLTR